jgi:redox-sensitive bicupin YhaK (pirin superfamily)
VVTAGAQGLHVLVGAGRPIGEPVVFGGPFVMTTQSDLAAAKARYQRGEMGRLAPSF